MYYVSITHGRRYLLAAGPYATQDEASDRLEQVIELAHRLDQDAVWYGFGFCFMKIEPKGGYPQGKFNAYLPNLPEQKRLPIAA